MLCPLILFLSLLGVNPSAAADDKCDIDHKLMRSIVELEHEHEVMKFLLSRYEQAEERHSETVKILESLGQSMRDIETKIVKMEESSSATSLTLQTHDDKLKSLEVSDEEQSENIMQNKGEISKVINTKGSGSTFTRWGRSKCPVNSSELVYDGYVGGSYHGHHGAAVNYLCLTKEPTWNQHQDGKQSERAYLYGGEYQFFSESSHYFRKDLHDHNPPCAVCRSSRPTILMIPGRNICYDGWTKEYDGYLVAGRNNHPAASEYICLDKDAEAADTSNKKNNDGKLIYLVEAKCGSLKCLPYKSEWEITCVVCSK